MFFSYCGRESRIIEWDLSDGYNLALRNIFKLTHSIGPAESCKCGGRVQQGPWKYRGIPVSATEGRKIEKPIIILMKL